MSFFSSLFRKRSDPSSWRELWEVLAPYGGALTPASARAWSDAAASMDPRLLATAREQLERAYELLDTQHAAAFVGGAPFTTPDRPFARRRFLRALDAVVVAGPDAVAQVAADPSTLRAYDTAPAVAPYEVPDPQGSLLERLDLATSSSPHAHLMLGTATYLPRRREAGWPALGSDTIARQFYLDPELGWVDVDASAVGVSQGEPLDPTQGWADAGRETGRRVFVALGSVVERPATLGLVAVVLLPREDWEGEVGSGLTTRDGVAQAGINEGLVELYVALSDAECATRDTAERIDLLVRRAAQALRTFELPFTALQASALDELARGERDGRPTP
ncbi:hypothetical protein [Oerskovia flava]|uniref:hypothetical protein n=1 Tax=Oerskovia flava TaxID=2986422 RepID=UPI00223F9303|nr:hypothetical protein [Oerskovia sp. JB1-3-2]